MSIMVLTQIGNSFSFCRSISGSFNDDPEELAACNCTEACVSWEYEAQVSSYRFPNDNWIARQGLTWGMLHILNELERTNIT